MMATTKSEENATEISDPSLEENVLLGDNEPVELIISRVVFALLISAGLVLNLLLLVAVIRRRQSVSCLYFFIAAMTLPDLLFYVKLIVELVDWNNAFPMWARDNLACGLWQFASHVYPILYSSLLVGIVHHAFIGLFLDRSGRYERQLRTLALPVLTVILMLVILIVAPSGFFSKVRKANSKSFCDLEVPTLMVPWNRVSDEMKDESASAYRLVYEVVLPFILPLVLLACPYICLLVGLMRDVEATRHSQQAIKMCVVVTLWLVTSFLMLHVASVLHNVCSVFSVWHKLMALFEAHDDVRVPKFQTYIHILSYIFTTVWALIRPIFCFKYNPKLRRALTP